MNEGTELRADIQVDHAPRAVPETSVPPNRRTSSLRLSSGSRLRPSSCVKSFTNGPNAPTDLTSAHR